MGVSAALAGVAALAGRAGDFALGVAGLGVSAALAGVAALAGREGDFALGVAALGVSTVAGADATAAFGGFGVFLVDLGLGVAAAAFALGVWGLMAGD